VEETVHHMLFECPAYHNEQHTLAQALGRKATSLKYLLNHKKGIHQLLIFIGWTGRLRKGFGDVTPKEH
jgi:hypothetical protein